jgi:hypothetical protein
VPFCVTLAMKVSYAASGRCGHPDHRDVGRSPSLPSRRRVNKGVVDTVDRNAIEHARMPAGFSSLPPGPAEAPAATRVALLARDVAGWAGVLYVFGFLSVRARLNALGVSTETELVNARYLREGAAFLVAVLEKVALGPGLVVVVAAMVAELVGRPRYLWPRARKALADRPRLVTLVAAVALVAVTSLVEHSMFTGGLEFDGSVELLWPALVTACTVALLWAVHHHGTTKLWTLVGVYLTLLVLLEVTVLPMIYGKNVRDRRYPFVNLSLAQPDEVTKGILLLQTNQEVVLRDPQVGRLVAFPTARVRRVETVCSFDLQTNACAAGPVIK